jgi:hypothetical protein
MLTDRQTDTIKLPYAFHNFANTPKKTHLKISWDQSVDMRTVQENKQLILKLKNYMKTNISSNFQRHHMNLENVKKQSLYGLLGNKQENIQIETTFKLAYTRETWKIRDTMLQKNSLCIYWLI